MKTKHLFYKIVTSDAPNAVASYSQGIVLRNGDHREVITSGQIAFDPTSGFLILGGIIPQTKQVLRNVGAILKAGGAQPGDIYQTDVVLTDASLFSEFNKVYGEWEWINGQESMPTRFTSVGGFLIPNAMVEVRCFAAYPAARGDIF